MLLTKILFYGNIKEKGSEQRARSKKIYRAEGTEIAVYPCAFLVFNRKFVNNLRISGKIFKNHYTFSKKRTLL